MTRDLNIGDIQIGQRHRKQHGDLDGLAASISEVGLLQPIGVTAENVLVFGERRLRACRDILGWATIPARVVNLHSIVDGEVAENECRKDFTPSEKVAVVESLRSFRHGGDRRSDRTRTRDVEPLTVDQLAKRVGLGGKDGYLRAKAVVERGIPELVDAMDRGEIAVSVAAEVATLEASDQRLMLESKGELTVRDVSSRRGRDRRGAVRSANQGAMVKNRVPCFVGIDEPMSGIGLNRVAEGDCLNLIPTLPDNSINVVVTSPPYAEQRNDHYPGVPEEQYPEFTVRWMSALRDKLADDGSVFIVIRPDLKGGVVKDYVLRTRLALREAGWRECETLIWHKPDGGACMGSANRPRRTYEEILWFSKTNAPFADIKAGGRWVENVSARGPSKGIGRRRSGARRAGRTKLTDVISVPVRKIARGVGHPAMFPDALAETIIKTFCPERGVVLDPYCGSGSTLVAAKKVGRGYYGFDIVPDYCEMARRRLSEEAVLAAG